MKTVLTTLSLLPRTRAAAAPAEATRLGRRGPHLLPVHAHHAPGGPAHPARGHVRDGARQHRVALPHRHDLAGVVGVGVGRGVVVPHDDDVAAGAAAVGVGPIHARGRPPPGAVVHAAALPLGVGRRPLGLLTVEVDRVGDGGRGGVVRRGRRPRASRRGRFGLRRPRLARADGETAGTLTARPGARRGRLSAAELEGAGAEVGDDHLRGGLFLLRRRLRGGVADPPDKDPAPGQKVVGRPRAPRRGHPVDRGGRGEGLLAPARHVEVDADAAASAYILLPLPTVGPDGVCGGGLRLRGDHGLLRNGCGEGGSAPEDGGQARRVREVLLDGAEDELVGAGLGVLVRLGRFWGGGGGGGREAE